MHQQQRLARAAILAPEFGPADGERFHSFISFFTLSRSTPNASLAILRSVSMSA